MKFLYRIIFLFLLIGSWLPNIVLGQESNSTYQLKETLKRFENQPDYLHDTAYANALIDLAYVYSSNYPDSALLLLAGHAERCHESGNKKGEVDTYIITGDAYQTKGNYIKALEYYEKSFQLAKKINYQKVLSLVLNRIGIIDLNQGNYPEALSKFYESLKAAEAIGNEELTGATLNNIAIVQFYQGKFEEAKSTYLQRLKIAQETADTSSMSFAYNGIGEINLQQKDPVKALQNLSIAYELALKINDRDMLLTATLSEAEAYYALDSLQKTVSLFENALLLSKQTDHGTSICNALIGLAKARHKQGLFKEALANGLEGLQRAEKMGQVQLMRDANEIVSTIYESLGDGSNALRYYRVYKTYSDSMNNLASQRAVAIEKASYEFSKKELAFERKTLQQRWLTFFAFALMLLLGLILWLIIRNRNRLKHANKNLQQKNLLIEAGKSKAEETLNQLRAAQAQLIQSEKMASLGELTAGIAHEIQNPLNFVNNFSEINNELIAEMIEEVEKGNNEEAKLIAIDISQNLEKINHHGKRADAIVKGMLQHSRKNTGKKEPRDINALCEEYLRLSYLGLRTKDKTFNAVIKTDFDKSIDEINIVSQDIGRALLNLFNNAFYSVNEPSNSLKGEQYQPTVTVSTKSVKSPLGDLGVLISVADNGNGIPQNIVDKIFQPFFTTKPTGQGTGLGLSLSYDIIKAHGGEIRVETKEGEGTTFIIQIPNT